MDVAMMAVLAVAMLPTLAVMLVNVLGALGLLPMVIGGLVFGVWVGVLAGSARLVRWWKGRHA